jgi:hypothetical protein
MTAGTLTMFPVDQADLMIGDRVTFTAYNWEAGEVSLHGTVTALFPRLDEAEARVRVRVGETEIYSVPVDTITMIERV